MRRAAVIGVAWASLVAVAWGAESPAPCRVNSVNYQGWKAVQVTNDWVRLTLVPQLGGRLMQLEFLGHPYLFVNPQYKGKYLPPSEGAKTGRWFNYGGDKVWPLPEGRGDDQHWPGPQSDLLDDGEYTLTVVSEGAPCTVHLQGPADPATGLQYSRDISLGSDSPEIRFHAVMTNASRKPIRWSIQSVSQYDTSDPSEPADYNRDFWAFAPVNPDSAYIDGYHVRSGLADDPSFAVQDGLFTLHWLYLENEVWLDSDGGWLAVIDKQAGYGMVERYSYMKEADYPGKASLIFYKNGAALELDSDGKPVLRSSTPDHAPYYMEAEINSPMIPLPPGASYAFDTVWFPVRAGKDFHGVSPAGMIGRPLHAERNGGGVHLTGSFTVFFPGKLRARFLDDQGREVGAAFLGDADPRSPDEISQTIAAAAGATRLSIHLEGLQQEDRGILGEAQITNRSESPTP